MLEYSRLSSGISCRNTARDHKQKHDAYTLSKQFGGPCCWRNSLCDAPVSLLEELPWLRVPYDFGGGRFKGRPFPRQHVPHLRFRRAVLALADIVEAIG